MEVYKNYIFFEPIKPFQQKLVGFRDDITSSFAYPQYTQLPQRPFPKPPFRCKIYFLYANYIYAIDTVQIILHLRRHLFISGVFWEPAVEGLVSFSFHFRGDVLLHLLYGDGQRHHLVNPSDDRQPFAPQNHKSIPSLLPSAFQRALSLSKASSPYPHGEEPVADAVAFPFLHYQFFLFQFPHGILYRTGRSQFVPFDE